jgi:uncharacterized protein
MHFWKNGNQTFQSFLSFHRGSMRLIILCLILVLSNDVLMSQSEITWSTSRLTAIRLAPHTDLKEGLLSFAKKAKLKSGFIATCVGSLEQVNLRFANQETGTLLKGHYEIISLVGTFSDTAAHLHLSVADSTGKTFGGHLLDESLIYTTAEIVIGELSDLEFDRTTDSTYGYKELLVKKRNVKKN